MLIKTVKDNGKKNEDKCPNCGHHISSRHQDLGYCEKCYYHLADRDEEGNRRVRFHVL